MLYYDVSEGIEVSEGIYVNKSSASKECIILSPLVFLDKGLKFQSSVCNGCHSPFNGVY